MLKIYSEKEKQMFKDLGYNDISNIEPIVLYRMAVLECFSKNKKGDAVESLRKTYNAFVKCEPYRLSKNFDNLIDLED